MDVIERELRVTHSAEAVWDLLATPEALGTWLGGDLDVELRAGAKGTFTADDGIPRRVVIVGVAPPRELRFSWWHDGDGGLVAITVDDDESERVVRVRERRLPSGHRAALGLQATA